MTEMIPPEILTKVTASERAVFELIKHAEDSDGLYCLHSVGLARHSRKIYSEADFVVIGAKGIYCLEVKGGNVTRTNGMWNIGWPNKNYQSSEGPFRQSETAQWALRDEIRSRLGTLSKEIVFGWGVVFPDIIFDKKDPEWDLNVVYDLTDKSSSFANYIERLSKHTKDRMVAIGWKPPPPLSDGKVRQIVQCLRGDFEVVQSLRGLVSESERELLQLSADQFQVLDYTVGGRNPRVLCSGGAGTGKTVVAVELARRLTEAGNSVLFLCFNENLRNHISSTIDFNNKLLKISTLHQFMGEIIRLGGFSEELKNVHESFDPRELFETVYPSLFYDSASILLDNETEFQFDAIIIDEAQDILQSSNIECLELVLDGGFRDGQWAIFLDSENQGAVYRQHEDNSHNYLRSFRPLEICFEENFRNPKSVVEELCLLTQIEMPKCRRNIVSIVEYEKTKSEKAQGKKLRALLLKILGEGVKPCQIAILSARRHEKSCVSMFPPDIGKEVHYLGTSKKLVDENTIVASSVSAFKGLESEVVILTDLESIDLTNSWWRSILYVGMTRTRTQLYLFVSNDLLQDDSNNRAETR